MRKAVVYEPAFYVHGVPRDLIARFHDEVSRGRLAAALVTGIHCYLTYLRDRLTVARDLLADSGSIFVQIADANMHSVRSLLDEVFPSRLSRLTKGTSASRGWFAHPIPPTPRRIAPHGFDLLVSACRGRRDGICAAE